MNKQNDAHPTAEASTGVPTRAGAIGLESRVLDLERAGNVTNRLRSASDGMTQIGTTRDATDGGYGDGKGAI